MAQTITPAPELRRVRTASVLAVLVIFLMYLLPLVLVLASSFKTNEQIANDPLGVFFSPTLEAYQAVVNPALWTAIRNSLIITALATVTTLVCAVPLAYALTRIHRRWTATLIGVLIALQMVPASTAVIPLAGLLPALGLIGNLPGVALAIATTSLPYIVLLLRPFYLAVPRETIEAAEIDGAGPFRTFFSVVIPLVRNGILVVTILTFIAAWGEFLYSISFLGESTKFPLSVLLVLQQGQFGTQYNNVMALALIGAVPTIILFVFTVRRLTDGLALGAGK